MKSAHIRTRDTQDRSRRIADDKALASHTGTQVGAVNGSNETTAGLRQLGGSRGRAVGIHRTMCRRISDGTISAFDCGKRHIRMRPGDLENALERIPTVGC